MRAAPPPPPPSPAAYRKTEDGRWEKATLPLRSASMLGTEGASPATAPASAPLTFEQKVAKAKEEHARQVLNYDQKLARAKEEHAQQMSESSRESASGVAGKVSARRLARAASRGSSPRGPSSDSSVKTQRASSWGTIGRQQDPAEVLRQLLADGTKNGLDRLLAVGEYCEQVQESDFDFFKVSDGFVRSFDWEADGSCLTMDVPDLFTLVSNWSEPELRTAVEECISDGGIHLQVTD